MQIIVFCTRQMVLKCLFVGDFELGATSSLGQSLHKATSDDIVQRKPRLVSSFVF